VEATVKRRGWAGRNRSGTAYIVVLGTTLIVSILALAGITATRIQRRAAENAGHRRLASLNAQTALDIGLHHIQNTSDWRQKAASGEWDVDTPMGDGFYRIVFEDPADGEVDGPTGDADYLYHPVVVTGIGRFGEATQGVRLRVDFDRVGVQALRSSLHSGGKIEFKGVAANSDHFFTSENDIIAGDDGAIVSQIYADVATDGSVSTSGASQFLGATSLDVPWPLTMPDENTVLDYYLANGTPINVYDIPLWDGQLLVNGSMEGPPPEDPTTGWSAFGSCSIAPYTAKTQDGDYALVATGRTTPTAGPGQDITDKLASGLSYHVQVHAALVAEDKKNGRLVVEYESTGEGLQSWTSPWVELSKGKFKVLESDENFGQATTFTPTWTGTLLQATLRMEMESSLGDLFVDAASLREITYYPSIIRGIHRTLLGPHHNPFGTGQTNPEGIYVIDCEGDWVLSIQRARISGTLVVLNPKAGTYVWSVVHWAPAVSNYPTLLSNGPVNFWLGNESERQLDEGHDNVNYNPINFPYRALSDADKQDVYPALMRGIVYTKDTIGLKYHPTLEGTLIAVSDILSESTDLLGQTQLSVTYLDHFYRDAPPGFRGPPVMRVLPASIRRAVVTP
jgi:hypothetical protein